ncbi:MAG: ribosome-associated translation inhibitor RaiA [Bacilli bacterium]
MKVNVRGKNKFEPSDALRNYAFNKLQKMNIYFSKNIELTANVLCKVYDDYQEVEITIPTKHVILRAEVKAKTIFGAIDLAIDKLESQIVKHKSKIYNSIKQREGIAKYYSENSDFDLEALKAEVLATNLVKSKSISLEPMTPDDAIMQMEMLGHDFFIFLNSVTNKTCVVYLREDNDYGIIETK